MFGGSSLFGVGEKIKEKLWSAFGYSKLLCAINWKHDHIRSLEKVRVDIITVRRDTVWCLLSTFDKGQNFIHWFSI